MKKFTFTDGAALTIWLLPVIYLWFIYSSLPVVVPMHYDIHNNVDSYGSRGEFLMVQALMLGVALLVYLLLKFLPAIDPKKQVPSGAGTFQKLAFGIVIFLTALNVGIIYATLHHGFKIDKLVLPVISLLFTFLGNVLYSIKPNYFAGIKTPWALESEDNWRATHHLAGKLWFVGGLILTITSFVLPSEPATIIFTSGTLVLVFVPYTYSYLYFRKTRSNQNS
jgi:uncharacterized membrane protein